MTDKLKRQLKSIFHKALVEAKDLVDQEMYNSGDFVSELEKYVDYIDHDVIDCLDKYMEEDEQNRDIPADKADAWYDNFKND